MLLLLLLLLLLCWGCCNADSGQARQRASPVIRLPVIADHSFMINIIIIIIVIIIIVIIVIIIIIML